MKHLHKFSPILLLWGIFLTGISPIQASETTAMDTVVTFRFLPGENMFTRAGNEAELKRLYVLIDNHKTGIAEGKIPVYVDGYCASLPTAKENLYTAFVRANRVKSELITRKGLKEVDFVTANYARAYNNNNKDMVVVTLRIPARIVVDTQPAKEETKHEEAEQKQAIVTVEQREEPAAEKPSEAIVEQQSAPVMEQLPAEPEQFHKFAVRTNVLYDAFLLPTLGVEWRVNRDLGIKLDGSLSWWGGKQGKVQKIWLLNPEVRWYLLDTKRFYVGLSGSYGEYNIYKGGIVSKNTGYQGKLWNAGLTAGYQLYLSHNFSIDFNLGLGYTRSEYDSFGMTDGVRVYKEKDKTKNFWGPTQAGISLIWTIGSNK